MEEKSNSSLPLDTERLVIRPFEADDLEAFHAIFGDPEAMHFIPSGVSATLEDSRRRLGRIIDQQEKVGLSLWAVVEKESGSVVGDCGLILVAGTGPEVEVAYHFRKSAWGKGYATEAARACLKYGIEVLGLERILALAFPEHLASQRVMQKCGMVFEGIGQYYQQQLVVYSASQKEL